jgi:hypothetical protein
VKDAKDDVIRGIESDLTTDSDAEDLEQLVTDSRQALHLTRAALDDVKRRATTAAAVNYDGPEDGAGNVAVTVDAVSRTRQLKLVSSTHCDVMCTTSG